MSTSYESDQSTHDPTYNHLPNAHLLFDTIEGVRPNAIIHQDPSGQWCLAPRAEHIRHQIRKDRLAMALVLAENGSLSQAEDSIACEVLHIPVRACENKCEVHTVYVHCNLTFCDSCGSGKRRTSNFFKRRLGVEYVLPHLPGPYLFTFYIEHGRVPQSPEDHLARQQHIQAKLHPIRERLRKQLGTGNCVFITADIIDPHSTKAALRVYYCGPDLDCHELRRQWTQAAHSATGSYGHVTWERAKPGEAVEVLTKALSGVQTALRLSGPERARYQLAFVNYRTIRVSGKLLSSIKVTIEEDDTPENCSCCGRQLIRFQGARGFSASELLGACGYDKRMCAITHKHGLITIDPKTGYIGNKSEEKEDSGPVEHAPPQLSA